MQEPFGTIVGFDTATATTTGAATRGDEVAYESHRDPGEGERPLHASALLGEVERAATAAGGWRGVDRIAVGIGPGTFTGQRNGIATARALAQGLEKPLVPVGSLTALAGGIGERFPSPDELRLPVLDARRGEAFAALYAASGEELWPPFVSKPEELAGRVARLDSPPRAAGDGSLRFRSQLEDAGARIPADGDQAHRMAARQVCGLAANADPVEPRRIEPVYLRRPDAELWRERQLG